jgi:glyoxylase-like metal-dependent hydrolase (beta-lactamase superfamily II)
MRWIYLLPLLCFLGCTKTTPRPDGQIIVREGFEGDVGTFVSDGPSFFTSSYWIEGPQGLILIDTQFLPSGAEKSVAWAEKLTGKKVVLAVVLHPNPDKFNGTAALQKRGIKVITSEQVKAAIAPVHTLRKDWFYDSYKPDYPVDAAVPESFGSSTQEISAAGTKIKLHVMGRGCSEAHVVAEWNGHLFPGDLVTNGFHSWLELGYVDEWIKRIDELRALEAKQIHPGRGASGDEELLDKQAEYLQQVVAIVKAEKPKGPADPRVLQKIQAKIEAKHPDYLYTKFVENGLEALWSHYAK